MAYTFDLLNLPSDALISVLSHLGFQDLLRVAATCSSLRIATSSDCLWMPFCYPWADDLNLEEWRSGVDSARALFRLLRFFNKIIGHWTARELAPRGGLLYVTWGQLSLVACRVLTMQAGELKLRRLFEVVGSRDGSAKVELFTTYSSSTGLTEIRLPGALVWCSSKEPEFYLELTGLCEDFESLNGGWSDSGNMSEDRFHETDHDRGLVQLLQLGQWESSRETQMQEDEFLDGGSMGDQQGVGTSEFSGADSQVHPERKEREYSLRHRTLQYLIRLASSSINRAAFDEHGAEASYGAEGNTGGPIARSLYCRIRVEEPVCGKELIGLWSGIYGPHGVEIINISYRDEDIVGTKILGDPNVPCGQVTFTAKLSSVSTQVPVNLQRLVDFQVTSVDQQFTIVKLYRGYGRIADYNFLNPQWIPGRLLIDQNCNIAFLWDDENFVISFQRLNLPSLYQIQKCGQQIF